VDLGKGISRAAAWGAVFMAGLVLLGCDENVEVIRDPDIRIMKGMTWAWRPMTSSPALKTDGNGHPLVSRDVITPQPQQRLESNKDWNTEANRKQLQDAIEKALKAKGLVETGSPATADFLVDYHVAVKTDTATVQRAYPGGYPGMVCGPYGCWSGWGWGPPEAEFQNVQYHVGTFVIDLALRNPKKLAYRAISQRELNKHTITPYQAEQAVNSSLKGLKAQ
jgi:hypothetical protein